MDDIRQSILSLDNSLKVLSTYYDSVTSSPLQKLNEQVNGFEKRWAKLIEDLEQCSTRVSCFEFFEFSFLFCFLYKKLSLKKFQASEKKQSSHKKNSKNIYSFFLFGFNRC